VSAQADALPDDPALLKAIVIAERLESERLRQIIREFQRHRFGRRAESLAEDQLQLALEDSEQEAAASQAESEQKNPAEGKARAARRRTNRGKLPAHLPRIETVVDVPGAVCLCCRSAWMSCRPSSGCWSHDARSTAVALARTWSCKRRHPRG
jgi:hypothetical protein